MQLGLGLSLVQATPAAAAAAPAGYFTHALSTGDSALLVCSQTVSPVDYYSADAELALGSLLFTDVALTTPADDAFYSADGVQYFSSVDGVLVDDPVATLCSAVALPEVLLDYDEVSDSGACSLGLGGEPYYFLTGESQTPMYLDPYRITTAPDGYYSDGVDYYAVSGGSGDFTGPTVCP